MHSILAQNSYVIFLAIAGFCLFSLGTGLVVLSIASRLFENAPGQVPAPAFIGIVATAWALAMGFAASDVWTLDARADSAASAERSAVMRLIGVSDKPALDFPELHAALKHYADLVRTSEWQGTLNRMPDPQVDAALQDIRISIIHLARQNIPAPLVAKAVSDFDELQDARNDRLAIGQSALDMTKWYLVLTLTVLTMISIAIVHAEIPKAGRNALAIFCVVVCACLWILAIHTNPYKGMPVAFLNTGALR